MKTEIVKSYPFSFLFSRRYSRYVSSIVRQVSRITKKFIIPYVEVRRDISSRRKDNSDFEKKKKVLKEKRKRRNCIDSFSSIHVLSSSRKSSPRFGRVFFENPPYISQRAQPPLNPTAAIAFYQQRVATVYQPYLGRLTIHVTSFITSPPPPYVLA